ncbi:MAG: T9SS type A sorting domain-containing protein [Melioribacteraceae bacterium]|nr:T9SS type A sorting domain-containing protein [Melioribacteraceae bacterium]
MIEMYDDGTNGDETAGDKIFTTEVEFPKFSSFRVQYKYGINYGDDDNNQGGNDNENGVGADHFVTLTSNLVSATVVNSFGVMGDHDITEIVTGIEEVEGAVPTAYELEQNYPNPFNPTTMIRFSIPEANTVTLKIYNMLGQEVTELLSEYKSAGKYEVSFDASQLSSGMYIYSIQSGNFISTKKMMLLK